MTANKPYLLLVDGTLDGFYKTRAEAMNRAEFRDGYRRGAVGRKIGPYFKVIYEPEIGPQETIFEGRLSDD